MPYHLHYNISFGIAWYDKIHQLYQLQGQIQGRSSWGSIEPLHPPTHPTHAHALTKNFNSLESLNKSDK